MANDVWVYIEHKGGGNDTDVLRIIGHRKDPGDGLGSGLCAFVIGENVGNTAKEAFQCGASKVYAVEGPIFKTFNAEAYSKASSFVLGKYKPEVAPFQGHESGHGRGSGKRCKSRYRALHG